MLQPRKQVFGDPLHLVAFGGGQLRCGPREDVEDHQLFFAEVFANVAFLFLVEAVRQLEQLLEDLLDVAAAVVVALDQRFELLGEVGSRAVETQELFQLGFNDRLQCFQVSVLVL